MILNDTNFLLYAAKAYDVKKSSGAEEFYEDLKRFQYLKRLFKRNEETDDLKIRLILNHIIVLYNCFGLEATNMLFFKLKEYHPQLKPFVLFLNYMPEVINYEEIVIRSSDISLDPSIVRELRNI
jgi:hypothetical protein